MIYDGSDPDHIAQVIAEETARSKAHRPVEADDASRAARMLSELL